MTKQKWLAQKKWISPSGKTQKKNEFNHCTFFSAHGSGPGPTLGFQAQSFMVSQNLGSVRSNRAGPLLWILPF